MRKLFLLLFGISVTCLSLANSSSASETMAKCQFVSEAKLMKDGNFGVFKTALTKKGNTFLTVTIVTSCQTVTLYNVVCANSFSECLENIWHAAEMLQFACDLIENLPA
ncbi:MAG: hypothetical protein ABIP79_05150 [Chitinophagaceae bacterium]